MPPNQKKFPVHRNLSDNQKPLQREPINVIRQANCARLLFQLLHCKDKKENPYRYKIIIKKCRRTCIFYILHI